MDDSFKNLIIAFGLIAIFTYAILLAISNMASDYGKDTTEVIGAMNMSGFNATINGLQSQADLWRSSFSSDSGIFEQALGVVTTATAGVGFITLAMFNLIVTPFNLIATIMENTLHIPSWVTSSILGLIIIAGIFGIIRLWKIGS